MSLLTLPEPDGWRGSRRLLMWLTIGTAIVFVPAVVWGVVVMVRGQYVTAIVMWGVAAWPIATMVSLWLVALGRTTLSAQHDSTGTTLLPDRTYTALFYAGCIGLIVAGSMFVVNAPRGELALPMSRGWQIFSPFLMGVVVVLAVIGVVNARRRGGVGHLTLTRNGVEVANIVSTKSVAWDDIADIKDSVESRRTRKAIALVLHDGTEEVIDSADMYVPRGSGLYWMTRQYWRNPDQRPELADGRAVERLSRGRFDCR